MDSNLCYANLLLSWDSTIFILNSDFLNKNINILKPLIGSQILSFKFGL